VFYGKGLTVTYEHLLILVISLGLLTGSLAAETGLPESEPMSFDAVEKMAFDLSQQSYVAPTVDVPPSLKELDYDAHRAIHFKHEKAVWAELNIPFRLEFFHRGYLFPHRIDIYQVENGTASQARFDPELFRYEGVNLTASRPIWALRAFALYPFPGTQTGSARWPVFWEPAIFAPFLWAESTALLRVALPSIRPCGERKRNSRYFGRSG
jgi:hypothetical protein